MKIYAIRDRLVDYYMQPFVADSDKRVLASIASTINNQEQNSAIQAAPQHFEVWTLGEVDEETGHITAKRELIADCASLVRPNIRGETAGRPGAGADGPPAMGGERPPDAPRASAGA